MLKSLFQKISPALIIKEAKASAREASEHEQRLAEVCALPAAEALQRLGTTDRGLDADDIATRRKEYGPNEIGGKKRSGALLDMLRRFRNPLVIQLLVIIAVSLYVSPDDLGTPIIVGVMVFLSVVLAHFQESRSNRAVEKLRAMVQTTVIVIRGGAEVEISFSELVPGDVVVLHAGSIIPADLRLISTKDFFVSQSALTGESMPVEKTSDPCSSKNRGTIELENACFQGSNVLSGAARGGVVLTGARTYFGAISTRLAGQQVQTSFDRGIAGFTWLMIRFMIVMVCAVFFIVGLTKHNWLEALMFAVSVAVGLTPEMLPMIVTVNLSKGALAMSRKKVIVKRLNSIQNFGAMDILCSDKTGTLTQDRVVLEKYVDVTNRQSEDVLRYAYMNSYYQTGLRNLLDRAVLAHSDLDVERSCPKVDEIPFDFQRRRMSVVIDYEDAHVLICKGAVEEVYRACDRYQVDEEINPLIDIIKNDLMEEFESLSSDGYRVLAIAYKEFPKDKSVFSVADENQMILLGYIAFFDPPKESTAHAIEMLHKSGVRVKVLTGDNALVTRKVCRDVGLDVGTIVTGDQLAGLDRDKVADLAEQHTVFARLSPSQKDDIIQALQRRGHVVGFLGDGINDAPSLKTSDVGISVDSAVDVAKESADIILLEKSLQVLEDGIIEGRRVFSNIIKYIRMGASSNFGNMFSVVGGSYFLPFLPMTSGQILMNNLLYDFSQTGIPTDRVDDEFLLKPRQWNIGNIKKFMIFIGPMSSIFDYATYFLMLYFFNCKILANLPVPADLAALFANPKTPDDTYAAALFHTGWFVESLLTQTMIVYIIRTRKIPFIQSWPSSVMLLTTLIVMAIGIWLPYSPFAHLLKIVPLPGVFWFWMAGFLLTYAVLTHFVKVWFYNRYGID